MKKGICYFLLCFLLYSFPGYGQTDSINELQEVVLSDIHLYRSSKSSQVQVLNDSVLNTNAPALTSILKFNSPLYFRENGPGMVASASFRGTTASQTAVIWNGININSQFTGQTDFNTILTSGYDNIAVRSGGGSVLYGSGAIGGSVHLNNNFRFGNGLNNRIRLQYGSFDTYYGSLDTEYSSEKISLQLNGSHHRSDNDFPYPNSENNNTNGDFGNTSISGAVAYLLNNSNTLRFYTNYFDGERGFSGTLTASSKSKYEDVNSRNLLEWKNYFGDFTSTLRLAHLQEHYKYFENRENGSYTFGKARTALAKYDLGYRLNNKMKLTGLLEFHNTSGEGTNIEGSRKRNTGSAGVLFTHNLQPLRYELSIRSEFSNRYNSPVLFTAGTVYDVTENYKVKLNVSQNYKIPTFNDLFWYAGGNLNLKPEKSLQAEVGQELQVRDLEFGLTGYLIQINDLLRWVPDASGLWRPVNTESVQNFGLEAIFGWEKSMGDHRLNLNSLYSYTKSRDKNLDKELIYVPKHKSTATMGYSYGNFSMYYQFLYKGSVFTSTDNRYELEGYQISNAGFNFRFGSRDLLKLGVEVNNLRNTAYQSLPSRPMPGRSISSSLTFKF